MARCVNKINGDGLWPDVLTKSTGKTAFNEAVACNIDTKQ